MRAFELNPPAFREQDSGSDTMFRVDNEMRDGGEQVEKDAPRA